ncbi:Uncharacterized protein R665 [Durusdinium trenchii]|uniref:Uncharacterized protein R665 n=1 Tax=Durusdinium trenchii TaxID=1381693 RepID=A0ABP0K403_9DINO
MGEEEAAEEATAPGESVDFSALTAAGVSREELSTVVSVLSRLHEAEQAGLLEPKEKCLRPLRKILARHFRHSFGHLPQQDELDDKERKKFEKQQKRERKQRQLDADKRWKENAELRASRLAKLNQLEEAEGEGQGCLRIPDGPAESEGHEGYKANYEDAERAESEYHRQQACYICKVRFSQRHHFYSHLCPACASLNFEKRHRTEDMTGRVCFVTGARVKIGFQVALKFLRMGARVLITSRFPHDARRRYLGEADSGAWVSRLTVIGADFRFLGGVEAMCRELCLQETYLDVIVNNAAQTIRRPAAYYAHLMEGEGAPKLAMADSTQLTPHVTNVIHATDFPQHGDASSSAALSQLTVLSEDRMKTEEVAMPFGQRDVHGQQIDCRSRNSWLLKLGEVETPEAAEVFCINTLAPFIINSALRPLLDRSPHPDRYIVNVSAMEGKFYRYKQPTHPHTNMAKAALNMMTRTCAEDLAVSGIYMNSVDTGWINDENPLFTAQRIAEDHNFQTPIDEIDAAARIVDPVLTGLEVLRTQRKHVDGGHDPLPRAKRGAMAGGGDGDCPPYGWFLKDYMQTEW